MKHAFRTGLATQKLTQEQIAYIKQNTDKSYREIAQELGVVPSTVWYHIHH